MSRFLLRRLFAAVVSAVAATALVFGVSRMQGDPRLLFLSEHTTQENWDAWGKKFGLDRPLVAQYFIWLGRAARGDLGASINESRPAVDLIGERLGATAQLALTGWSLSVLIGVPLGVLSAVRRATVWDYTARSLALMGQAMPPVWLGIMLILLFSVQFKELPPGTRGGFDTLIMPAFTLALLNLASNLRLTRSAMLEVLDSEYVKFARSKGVAGWSVVWKHAFRNAAIGPLTNAGLLLAAFLAGTVVTETVFAWPGLGRLAVNAVVTNDFPVITGVTLVFTLFYIAANLLVDIAYAVVDPRIRYK